MALNLFLKDPPAYSDLDLDFFPNPATYDIARKVGDEAIKRAVRNIIFTNFYEKPFYPSFGSNVRALLFENCTPVTAALIDDAITSSLQNFESRIIITSLVVTADPDNNGFNVKLEYIIKDRQLPVITTLFLERIR